MMPKRLRPFVLLLGFISIAWSLQSLRAADDDLAREFATPPDAARPWVYWFWCNGNVTREGITADLEAMRKVGIGGVLIMEVDVQTPAGPVPYGSPKWHEMTAFAIHEAARLGLKVNMTNAPGWCGSGGPWNTPEHGEQHLVYSETTLTGGQHYDAVVPKPAVNLGFYRDVALLAFPALADDNVNMDDFSPVVTVSDPTPGVDPQRLVSHDPKTLVTLPVSKNGAHPWFQVAFPQPYKARTLKMYMNGQPDWTGFEADIQKSDDGQNFTTFHHFVGNQRGVNVSFPEQTARCYRVVFTKLASEMTRLGLVGVEFNPRSRFDGVPQKIFEIRNDVASPVEYPSVDPSLAVDSSRLIDLTSRMDAGGHLRWDVPPGKWTLVRLGHTPRGVENHPAPNGGLGLECDKLSKEAVDAHFAGLMEKVIADAGPLTGKTLVTTHIDSWETGTQNWTEKFREEFKQRCGYDLLPYLPAITGRIVDTPEKTERFLWDFRRTIADLLDENYAGHMRELAHAHGMKLSIEAYGDCPTDNNTYGAQADEPMCEFWRVPKDNPSGYGGDVGAPSTAHVYGKPIVPAESFTSDRDERWLGYPGDIKAEGDWAFTVGINRFVFHRYAMQPWLDVKPGMSMGPFGLHYERTQTWWDELKPWHEYLARCQELLQQGLWVADVCHVEPERYPSGVDTLLGPGPLGERPGYNYDFAPAAAVISRFSVRDGRIVLPDGMSYRVLALSGERTMTPKLLRKIKELVNDGATVIGPKPLKSPSLVDYPKCDDEIASLANEIWGDCDGEKVKEHAYGQGRVIWNRTPDEVLAAMNVPKDFSYDDSRNGPSLLYCHHRLGDADYYFVSNKLAHAVAGTAHFRVGDRAPEFWWPETGRTEPVAAFTQAGGVTAIPMQLDAAQSVFVVFRHAAPQRDPVASVALDGTAILPAGAIPTTIAITKATYGPADDAARTIDVTQKLQAMIDGGHLTRFQVAQVVSVAGDPAPMVVKTLKIDYTANGAPQTAQGIDPETIALGDKTSPIEHDADLSLDARGGLQLQAWKAGSYTLTTASGATRSVTVPPLPDAMTLDGPWQLAIPLQNGDVALDKLDSWSDSDRADVKYFSGTATYHKTFTLPDGMIGEGKRLYLDLGDVQVNAQVALNGKELGLLWKAPYRVEITGAAVPGNNVLEIKVTNLWPNRQIGDQQLPANADRQGDGSLKSWPQWLQDGQPDPSGRQTFTSWELWKASDAPIPSGLIGPVTVQASETLPVPSR